MSLPQQHKALYLLSKGGELAILTVDVPSYGPADVLLRVEAAGLNPIDWKIQDTGLFTTTFPTILGFDAAGIVVALGANVDRLKVGDRALVQGHFPDSTRTFQQFLATDAAFVAKIPDTMSFDDAATLPVSIATAAVPLYNSHEMSKSVHLTPPWVQGGSGKYAGKAAVVLGGTSAVGQAAIQFLKLSGFSPIIVSASLRNTQFVQSFGATHVVDRTLPRAELVHTIQTLAGGPIELVYDAISVVETKELGYEITTPGGSLIIVISEQIDHYKMPLTKDVRVIEVFSEFSVAENREFGATFAVEFEKLLRDGVIKPGVPEVIAGGLNGVQEGVNRIKADKVSGRKLVVHPQESV